MHLQKTVGTGLRTAVNTAAGKLTHEKPAKNVLSNTLSVPLVKSASASPRSVSSLITAAGLPADRLSAAIVSFTRFFSLPLKPQLLADIRRQAFTQAFTADNQSEPVKNTAAGNSSGSETAARNREALSLAAAAAESKGVELQPKGLEIFAEAAEPDWLNRQDERQRGKRNKNQNEQEKENSSFKTGSITACGVKELALLSAENDPLLRILNRLPGKNGQMWIILPFKFSENDIEYNASLRILLETERALNRAVCMALDISINNGQRTNCREVNDRWLFVLESAGEKPMKLSVYLPPDILLKAHSVFSDELSELLEIPPERISIKTMTESFPFESGCTDEPLCAIDEEA